MRVRFLRYVPKNHLSRTIGRLVHLRWPRPIARRLVHWFANTYSNSGSTLQVKGKVMSCGDGEELMTESAKKM